MLAWTFIFIGSLIGCEYIYQKSSSFKALVDKCVESMSGKEK